MADNEVEEIAEEEEDASFQKVTRVEVIDSTGRVFTQYFDRPGVVVATQDQGRTLKVFIDIE